jgi:hypothetical protein
MTSKFLEVGLQDVLLCAEPKVSPATFCRVFPFHLLFDRELRIVQTGSTVARVIPRTTRPGCRITDILDMVSCCHISVNCIITCACVY